MYEKVNPMHPDKIADRIAGAIVDMAYTLEKNPRIAVEVLIGHKQVTIVIESSVVITGYCIGNIVRRIAGDHIDVRIVSASQDPHLAKNQESKIRCGDNGIFKGMPVTQEQQRMVNIARHIYRSYPCDGKYIIDGNNLIICQSNAKSDDIRLEYPNATVNPLGDWTGGTNVDAGATNRKLGSDMGDAVTGGGIHGKDLSKADVSVNIYAHILAQKTQKPVELCCAIGDETVNGVPYEEIVMYAKDYVDSIGGFEKLAEWGLIR